MNAQGGGDLVIAVMSCCMMWVTHQQHAGVENLLGRR
jgi:hypothetical protein